MILNGVSGGIIMETGNSMIKSLKWESAGADDHKGLGEGTHPSENVYIHFGFFVKQGEKSLECFY